MQTILKYWPLLLPFSAISSSRAASPEVPRTSWDWSYANQGIDWAQTALPPDGFTGQNECGEPELQSPINLMQPIGSYGWAYGEPLPFESDLYTNHYSNSPRPSVMFWKGKRLQTKFSSDHIAQNFVTSQLGVDLYGSPGPTLHCKGFHFHTPAEHTIDGQQFELEFHLGHKFGEVDEFSTVKKSDMAIFFSETHYNRAISVEEQIVLDTFFDSINLDGADRLEGFESTVNFVELMELFDFDDRWIYIGSSTAPPCTRIVYRHIFRTVYPISRKYLFFIKKMMKRHEDDLGGVASNSRAISKINGHQVFYIGAVRLPGFFSGVAAVLTVLLSIA